jgi:hypothetical protein
LEKIDQETENLDITFIKINDPRYAKKYGVNKLPALVYFRKKFPSIYRGKHSPPHPNPTSIDSFKFWKKCNFYIVNKTCLKVDF